MFGKMIVLKANGTKRVADFHNPPDLETLQKAVGGWIEKVPYFYQWEGQAAIAYCNEEGKLRRLPFNQNATAAWMAQFELCDDVLVGDVVVLTGDEEFMAAM